MRAGTRTWLTGCFDAITAAAAVAVIVAPHWPWYVATLTPPDPDGNVHAPSGTATGISAHVTLWAVTALAAAQLAILLARHIRGGRHRVPGGDKGLLVLAAVLACLLVLWDADFMPHSWANILSMDGPMVQSAIMWPAVKDLTQVFPGTNGPDTLRLTWTYGATTAVWAALTLLLASAASPGPPARAAGKNPGRHLSPAAGGSLRETAAD
jgi:hypothetical protein